MNTHLPKWLIKLQQNFNDSLSFITGVAAQPFLSDWRGRYHSQALAVAFPSNSDAVVALVKACIEHKIAMIPQGGNTGLVGGAAADLQGDGRHTLVINLSKLRNQLLADPLNRSLTASAGYTLKEVQSCAEKAGLYFPLSLASEGSCTIGGNLSTNAGGTAVLRYGNARDLVLGLEAVLPNGNKLNQLHGLRKNNCGYDLKHLFMGAEGTLGIITTATLKLFSLPKRRVTLWVAFDHIKKACDCLTSLFETFDAQLTAFEWIENPALELVIQQFKRQRPCATSHGYALVELSDFQNEANLLQLVEKWAEKSLKNKQFNDCMVAQNEKQRTNLWQLRELISAAQAKLGLNIKHDIALPISNIPNFIEKNLSRIAQKFPNIQPVIFGHLGDGNLHYNFSAPPDQKPQVFLQKNEAEINSIVYEDVLYFNGSISAEHGIGLLKRELFNKTTDRTTVEVMRNIKQSMDPLNLMNPKKII